MQEAENRRSVQRLYDEGWGKGKLEVFDQVFAPRNVLRWTDQVQTMQKRSVSELKEIVTSYREAFPDLKVTIGEIVAEGDKVAIQVTFEGTHTKPYEGFLPTNKKSRFPAIQKLTFSEGKIVESTLGSGGLKYFFGVLDGSLLA